MKVEDFRRELWSAYNDLTSGTDINDFIGEDLDGIHTNLIGLVLEMMDCRDYVGASDALRDHVTTMDQALHQVCKKHGVTLDDGTYKVDID